MTREEASKVIKDGLEDMSLDFTDEEQYEALIMAIKALEQESCDDCVSRQAVLDLFGGCVEEEYPKISYVVKKCINDLPSVQPKITTQIDKCNFSKEQYNADLQCAYDCGKASVQPKREKGEWIPIGYDGFADGNPVYDVWECSCCKEERYGDDESLPNFCPNCGADMRGEKNV